MTIITLITEPSIAVPAAVCSSKWSVTKPPISGPTTIPMPYDIPKRPKALERSAIKQRTIIEWNKSFSRKTN